jgi:small neutral amino acid transporter SnatA (MarC family)
VRLSYVFTIFMTTLGPLGAIPTFYLMTQDADGDARRRLAVRATPLATLIVLFIALGERGTLEEWHVSLESLQAAGGILLFLSSVAAVSHFSLPAPPRADPFRDERVPQGAPMNAGYTPGVPGLGAPALLMRDASLGITNPGYRPGDTATAVPAAIALGASVGPTLVREGGAMLGREARLRGLDAVPRILGP